MLIRLLTFLCVLHVSTGARAENSPVFVPPKAYELERYASALALNPFVLRTAPEPVRQGSLLEDWTLASVYGDVTRPTVVVLNMRTRERVRLRQDASNSHGIRLMSMRMGDRRKDMLAIVAYKGERVELRFNSEWLRQAAMGNGTPPPTAPGIPHATTLARAAARQTHEAADRGTGLHVGPPPQTRTVADAAAARRDSAVSSLTVASGRMQMGSAGNASPEVGQPTAGAEPISDTYVYVPLEGGAAIPLRRHLLRPAVLAPHPDPQ